MKIKIALLSLFLATSICYAGKRDKEANPTLEEIKEKAHLKSEKGFIENRGQLMDMEGNPVPFVLFKTEAPGVNLWITEQGMTMQTLILEEDKGQELASKTDLEEDFKEKDEKITIHWERIDLLLKGASIKKGNIIKENPMQGHSNYFYPHCPDGIYGVQEYQKVTIQNVYPNIDWVIYRTPNHHFKYDFVVQPGGDYKQIELIYHSKTPIQINEEGQLDFTTNYGNFQENKPVSFYEDQEVKTQFKINAQKKILINEDEGYETSIGFNLELGTWNFQLSAFNFNHRPSNSMGHFIWRK